MAIVFYTLLALAAVLAGYLSILLLAWAFGEKIAFPAPKSTYIDIPQFVTKITLPDGCRITASVMKTPDADKWVLYSHGNGEDLFTIRWGVLQKLAESGFNVIAYDYCGYGTSEGKATEKSAYAAADAVWSHLTGTLGVKPQDVIIMGFSIGSAPSIYLAQGAGADARALVVVGGLAKSSYAVFPFDIIPWDFLDNISKVRNVRMPSLFIHGTADRVLNRRNSKMLHAACGARSKRLVLLEGLGHNGLPEEDAYWNALLPFLNNPNIIEESENEKSPCDTL